MIIEQILKKLRDCDDFHNRCDCLLEHNEITYLLEYITKLNERINRAITYCELNKEFTPRLEDVTEILKGE